MWHRPLSTRPRKSVCGLTRASGTMRSAASASLEKWIGTPPAVSAITVVAIDAPGHGDRPRTAEDERARAELATVLGYAALRFETAAPHGAWWVPAAARMLFLGLGATVVSFVVGYTAIAWLLKWLTSHSLTVFVVYRFALGALLIVLLASGTVSAH